MIKCSQCGHRFSVSKARQEYNDEFDEFDGKVDYDEQYEGRDICASCAITDTLSKLSVGMAFDTANDDKEFDDDFFKKWL